MAEVIVVRHGETMAEQGICIGRTNVPLSERGRKRAEILGAFLQENYPDIDKIITSRKHERRAVIRLLSIKLV